MTKLLETIRKCEHCRAHLPLGPRPVLSYTRSAKIMIVGQAPGLAVHNTGIPWNDKSGDRLREWLQVDRDTFYDPKRIAIVPMGFCYPGRGKSGDLPPRKECAELWMKKILAELSQVEMTLLVGQYALAYFLGSSAQKTLTQTVQCFRDYAPRYWVLPHPSPRNNIWLKKNPWFEQEVIPEIRNYLKGILT